MRFLLLGPVQFLHDGRVVEVRRRQERSLLCVLLLEPGRVVPSDRLLDLLWDGSPPASGRATLHTYIARLRQTLKPFGLSVLTRGGGYMTEVDPDSVDVHRFRALLGEVQHIGDPYQRLDKLNEALSLWRGPFMADVTEGNLQTRLAAGLDEQHLTALELRAEALLTLGMHREASSELMALIAEYPTREHLHELHMLALYRAGRKKEALHGYRSARQILVDELGLEPSPRLQELHQRILSDEPGLTPDQNTAGSNRVWQMPPDLPAFTGRAAQLEEIAAQLANVDGQPTTVCVSGLGGVGKTSLLVHAAYKAASKYQDGAVFIDLRGTDTDPPEADELMGSILRCLGLPGTAIPDDPTARTGLYRDLLGKRQLLLVLDNAANERQVRSLIPSAPGCAVIVSSRRALSGLDSAYLIDLGVLIPEEAVELLATVAGSDRVDAEREEALRLVDLCGYLPLALRIVGVRLHRRDGLPLSKMAERLTQQRSRLDELTVGDRDVRAVFATSADRLDQKASALLTRLGLLPTTRSASWIAATLLDESTLDTELVLDRLVEASLLGFERQGPEPTFRMHDLVHLFAREQAGDDDVIALRRCYESLGLLAKRSNRDLPIRNYAVPEAVYEGPDGAARVTARRWFSQHLTLLLLAAQDAASRGWNDLCGPILVFSANFALLDGYHDEWADATESVLKLLSEPSSNHPELVLGIGVMRQAQGRYLDARSHLREARVQFRKAGDHHRAAAAAVKLSASWRMQGAWRPGWASIAWAFEQLTNDPETAQRGYAYIALGNLLLENGRRTLDANEAFRSAVAILSRCGDLSGEANATTILAQSSIPLGDHAETQRIYNKALKIFDEIEDVRGQCAAFAGLGRVALLAGDVDGAAQANGKLLELARRAHLPQALKSGLLVAGHIEMKRENFAGARDYYHAGVVNAREVTGPIALASALRALGKAHLATGDILAALAAGREALELYSQMGRHERDGVAAWIAEVEARGA